MMALERSLNVDPSRIYPTFSVLQSLLAQPLLPRFFFYVADVAAAVVADVAAAVVVVVVVAGVAGVAGVAVADVAVAVVAVVVPVCIDAVRQRGHLVHWRS